jgi:lysozyme
MRRTNEFDRERTDGDYITRLDAMQHDIAENAVLIELAFRQAEREARSINRNIELLQDVRQRTEMIFVSVGENDRSNLVAILFEDLKVRNANVDAIDALFGKPHAGVDNDHLVAITQQRAIHPKLADAAEGDDFQDIRHLSLLLDSLDGLGEYSTPYGAQASVRARLACEVERGHPVRLSAKREQSVMICAWSVLRTLADRMSVLQLRTSAQIDSACATVSGYTMRTFLSLLVALFLPAFTALAQSPEFSEPWKNPNIALAIDPYEKNDIDWDKLATEKRVVAIIHRATIGDRVDRKYVERREEAKNRGYKWGAYHFGRPGDPIKQADFFLKTVMPADDELIALDLESLDEDKNMSLEEARVFIKRIQEKTGRYPLIYANNEVTKAILEKYGADDLFSKTHLWYARFKRNVTDFPSGTWKTYTVWQFSSEQNCSSTNRAACLYTVPGTEYDMDLDVFNGTIEELRSKWPFER